MPAILRQILSRVTSDRHRMDRSRFRRRLRPDLVVLEDRINPSNVIVTGLSPTSGPTASGTIVTIMGTGFTNVTAVDFGTNNPATTFNVASNGLSLMALSPAGTGTVDLTVTTPGGTSATSNDDLFTYAPTVSGIRPSTGPLDGGTLVTITGKGFAAGAAVEFGTTMATNVTVVNASTITASSPPVVNPASVGVTVTTSSGTSATSPTDVFTYAPKPTVLVVSPSDGALGGGTFVTITGTGFDGATAVDFGTSPATDVTVVSDTTITAESPAGTGNQDVTVTTPGGMSPMMSAPEFDYMAAPTVSGLSVAAGPAAGGTMVTITGNGFTDVSAVDFGTNPATILPVSSSGTSLTVVSPAGTPGLVDVTVTATGGTSATSMDDLFTYVAGPTVAPTVTGISPITGPVGGGILVTITGSNLADAALIEFGQTPVTTVVSDSAGQIAVVSPPATGISVANVTVTTPAGMAATSSADLFFYASAPAPAIAPSVSGISPAYGSPAGGTIVTITGTGFIPTSPAAVYFGTSPATNVTVVSATTITAESPAGTGTVGVTVITPGGSSSAPPAEAFTYTSMDGPRVLGVQFSVYRAAPTSVVIDFNGPLDASTAQNVSTYQIVGPGGRRVKVKSANYNPVMKSVTLVLAERLKLHTSYRLTVNGTTSSGLKSLAGYPLDGAGDNEPGSNYVTTLTERNFAAPTSRRPIAAVVKARTRSNIVRVRTTADNHAK